MFYSCLSFMISIVNSFMISIVNLLCILLPDFLETVVKEDADRSHQSFLGQLCDYFKCYMY